MDAQMNGTGSANTDIEIAPEPETLPMDDAFIAIVAECRQAAQAIEAQARGALILFLRQHGLQGEWRIADNGRELIRR